MAFGSWIEGPRLILEASQSFEEGATFVIGCDDGWHGLFISVAEEHAVDSSNQSFECTLRATMEQARQLRDWLIENVPDIKTE